MAEANNANSQYKENTMTNDKLHKMEGRLQMWFGFVHQPALLMEYKDGSSTSYWRRGNTEVRLSSTRLFTIHDYSGDMIGSGKGMMDLNRELKKLDVAKELATVGLSKKSEALPEIVEPVAKSEPETELQWIDTPKVTMYRFETANNDLLMVAPMLVAAEAFGFELEAAYRLVKECEQDGCSALFFSASRPSKMFGMRSVIVRKEVR